MDAEVLRVAVSGSGRRSRTVWQRHIRESAGFELVGVQDVAPAALDELPAALRFADVETMLEETRPDALVVCPVHAAHAEAARAGLRAGCHVLVEKPLATELADAVDLVRLAESRGLTLGVVQNWRTKSAGRALRTAVAGGTIGDVSHVFFRYLRDRELAHLPDYLFEEVDPLLYAMTIHHVDLFRYALDTEITRVSGHAHRPSWSRYRNPTVIQLWLETAAGVAVSYAATFSARGARLAQESLQVEGELGTIANESEYFEPPLVLYPRGGREPVDLTAGAPTGGDEQYVLSDTALLRNFHAAVLGSEPLVASGRDNLGTLAAIEAARLSIVEGRPVETAELLNRAYEEVT